MGCRCPLHLSRSPPPTCLFACLHASRNVWPACVPHRIHAPMQARVGARACACARAACSPALGRGLRPFHLRRLLIPGRPRACLIRLPDSLQPFPPFSPERGSAFCLPRRLIDFRPFSPVARLKSPVTRRPAIQPGAGATVGRCLPAVRVCQVWGVEVQHMSRKLDDCRLFFRFQD